MPRPETLVIRPIELADVPALLKLMAQDRGAELPGLSAQQVYAAYQKQRTLYFVALLGDEVVGGAGVAPVSAADPLTCELQRLHLRADARGRGIGDALLESCLAAARQFLYVRCVLEAGAEQQAAIEFYGRHGFRDLGAPLSPMVERRPLPGADRWMIRPLRASARAVLRA